MKLKWDGHTHSQLCRHGSGEKTEELIKKAIDLGFQQYSITEHAPVSEKIIKDQALLAEYALFENEMEAYFSLVDNLKNKFQGQISILCGLEIDFFIGHEEFTNEIIKKYSDHLEDIIISLHFIEGKGGLRCIDWSPDDFRDGLLDHYKSLNEIHHAYWKTFKKMIDTDIETDINIRIGHPGLIYKFKNHFPIIQNDSDLIKELDETFKLIHLKKYEIDFNIAGARNKIGETGYLTKPLRFLCSKYQIPLVYGSDSHSLKNIGNHYLAFEKSNN